MTTSTQPRRHAKRYLSRLFTLFAVATLGLLTLMAAPASATQRCHGQFASNVCLDIELLDGGNYLVHIGIDYHVSRSDAQAIIGQRGDPFFTVVMRGGQSIFIVPETDIGASDDFGLSADFDTTVLPSQLGGTVFGRIKLTDNRVGERTFDTPTLSPPY